MKRLLAILLIFAMCFTLVACGSETEDGGSGSSPTLGKFFANLFGGSKNEGGAVSSDAGSNVNSSTMGKLPANPPQKPAAVAVGDNGSRTDDEVGFQLQLPEIGEKIAVFETTKGNIYMRLFPESAPITVTNFVGLIEAGYYDGITFHRVMDNFMIQGGDPKGNGTGGESVWGGDFVDEFNANLLNIRGSLSMANSGANTNGSQFFINQAKEPVSKVNYDYSTMYDGLYDANIEALKQEYEAYKSELTDYPDAESYAKYVIDAYIGKNMLFSDDVSNEAWELYRKHGGNIHLDGAFKRGFGGHSVFAQVFSGMDVVDAIAGVEVDSNSKPTSQILITKAYTTTVTEEILALADKVEDDSSSQVVGP